ncbi:MAG: hypothetical protein JW784_05205 [Candidatus Cloacimonetes bacterium]|nr:hypothetical protein [Candidatus Cloacimonadota bacterium]
MPICTNCGVELKEGTSICPLCGSALDGSSNNTENEKDHDYLPVKPVRNNMGKWIWDLFTFLMISGFLVVFAVDFAYGWSIGWSRIPLVAIGYIWLAVTLGVKIRKSIYISLLCEIILLMLFLWALNLLIPGKPWFGKFVFPFLIFTVINLESSVLLIRKFKLRALNIVFVFFISLGVFLLCLEALLNRFLHERLFVSWSMVAFACLLVLSGFIPYFKHRIKKRGIDLEKFLHT